MIALDTSAIMAIALAEAEEEAFSRLVAMGAVVGAPTLIETRVVLIDRLGTPERADLFLDAFLDDPSLEISPFSAEHYRAATHAIDLFGKGRGNRAQLNLGDCMSYATAKCSGLPLLFKGNDFIHTDIRPAYVP
jgi:ribonuclease VapC